MTPNTSIPLSRTILVDAIPAGGQDVAVEATPDECAALARADGLPAVDSLSGRFRMTTDRSGSVRATGTVRARVRQTCTVSLEPFDADVIEDVDVTFLPPYGIEAWYAKRKARAEEVNAADEGDPPEAIIDGRIDIGALTAEFLALGLDPYPRKPSVVFDAEGFAPAKDPSPFAALAKLKSDP